jgi:hypothetical protein
METPPNPAGDPTPEQPAQEAPAQDPQAEDPGGKASQGWSDVLLAGTRDLAVALPKKIFEIDFDLSDTTEELKKKIAWIIRVRFVVAPAVVLLMWATNWQGLTRGASALSRVTLYSTALTAAVSIVLNLVYFWLLKRRRLTHRGLRRFVFLQLWLDVLIFAVYIWRTGGVTSPFSFLYFLPIIGSSILLGPGAGMGMAGISAGTYMTLVSLESFGALPHVSYFVDLDVFAQRTSYVLLMVLVNLFAFVAMAGASGFLMRQVLAKARELKELNLRNERKAGLFRMLYQVSEVLQHNEGMDEVLDRICDVLVTDLDVDRALMYVTEGEQLKLRRVAYHARIPRQDTRRLRIDIPLDPSEGLTARCAVANQAYNVTDPTTQDGINVELARQIGMNPFALAPMTYRGKVLGVLGVDRGAQRGVIAADELEVLILFARQAGQTLAMAARTSSAVANRPGRS